MKDGLTPVLESIATADALVIGSPVYFGSVTGESLCAFDTCQVDDYAKVVIESFDPAHKAKRRAEALPLDCQRAFDLGKRLAGAETVAA